MLSHLAPSSLVCSSVLHLSLLITCFMYVEYLHFFRFSTPAKSFAQLPVPAHQQPSEPACVPALIPCPYPTTCILCPPFSRPLLSYQACYSSVLHHYVKVISCFAQNNCLLLLLILKLWLYHKITSKTKKKQNQQT